MGWDGMGLDGTGYQKCPSNFFILSDYLENVYTYIYILKNCHQHSYGFQNFMRSWGSWWKKSKLQKVTDVSFFRSKSSLFFHRWNSFLREENTRRHCATTPNLTWNFETHKNIGENFDYMYRFMYTLSMYRKGINIIEGYFGYQKWTFRPKKRKITYLL